MTLTITQTVVLASAAWFVLGAYVALVIVRIAKRDGR